MLNSPFDQGVARLPVELLVIVAGFLAGQNSYGTLASLAGTCKLLKGEIAPTLYETVILDSNRQWWRDGGDGLTVKQIFEESTLKQRIDFRYTRYDKRSGLVSDKRNADSVLSRVRYIIAEKPTDSLAIFFPKRAVLIHKCHMSFQAYITFGSHRDAPCCLHLYKPVSASVLAQLLSIPLHWRETRVLQHITGIERLKLVFEGAVIGTAGGGRLLPIGNASSKLEIVIGSVILPTSAVANTVQEISRELHPSKERSLTAWKKPVRFSLPIAGNFARDLKVFLGTREVAMLDRCLDGVSFPPWSGRFAKC